MTEQAAQDPNMPALDEVEAVETPTEETETKLEGQAETAPAEVEETGYVETENDKIQKRINKITAEKYAEKRRADDLERKLNEASAHTPQAQTQNVAEPKLEDFDYDEAAYTAALIDFKVSQKVKLEADNIQQRQQQAQATERAQQVSNDFNLKVATFIEKSPDYEQVVANVPQLPEQTLNAIMQHEKGPEMAYYLGKHLDVADSIANSDPITAAMTLGQISAQLDAKPKQVVTSAAPDPIVPVGSAGVSNRSQDDMSMEEIYNME